MTRYLFMLGFIQDHAKSMILATGAIGIWVAQMATEAMDAAEKIGGWSAASVLALVCIGLAAWTFYREKTDREDRKDREAKQEAREQRFLDAIERNTEGYEKMCDLIQDVKTEVTQTKIYHETVIKELTQRGLNAPPVPPLARTRPAHRT